MRATISALILVVLAAPLSAQDPHRWEYGRLSVSAAGGGLAVPTAWAAGDSTVESTALLASAARRQGANQKTADPLIQVMNELSFQGWEFMQSVPLVGFVFRRHRSQ